MFLSYLWKKRKANRTQSTVLGDNDEPLMCLMTESAKAVVEERNRLYSELESAKAELESLRRVVRSRNEALLKIRERTRLSTMKYSDWPSVAGSVFEIAVGEIGLS